MPRKIEQLDDGAGSFECLVPDQLPELFVDGISQIALGMPVTRILFHASIPPQEQGEKIEQRVVVQQNEKYGNATDQIDPSVTLAKAHPKALPVI